MGSVSTIDGVLEELLAQIAEERQRRFARFRICVDGRDGAGKSTFADRLGSALRDGGAEVHRASIDDWQRPSVDRYRRGRESPEGYYLDSFDSEAVRRELLDPFAPNGSGRCRLAAADAVSDREFERVTIEVGPRAVLVFDGVFLHRPELAGCWELSIYLRVDEAVALDRGVRRDTARSHDGEGERRLYERRYAPGQTLYHDAVRPELVADVVVDNTDLARPVILRR